MATNPFAVQQPVSEEKFVSEAPKTNNLGRGGSSGKTSSNKSSSGKTSSNKSSSGKTSSNKSSQPQQSEVPRPTITKEQPVSSLETPTEAPKPKEIVYAELKSDSGKGVFGQKKLPSERHETELKIIPTGTPIYYQEEKTSGAGEIVTTQTTRLIYPEQEINKGQLTFYSSKELARRGAKSTGTGPRFTDFSGIISEKKIVEQEARVKYDPRESPTYIPSTFDISRKIVGKEEPSKITKISTYVLEQSSAENLRSYKERPIITTAIAVGSFGLGAVSPILKPASSVINAVKIGGYTLLAGGLALEGYNIYKSDNRLQELSKSLGRISQSLLVGEISYGAGFFVGKNILFPQQSYVLAGKGYDIEYGMPKEDRFSSGALKREVYSGQKIQFKDEGFVGVKTTTKPRSFVDQSNSLFSGKTGSPDFASGIATETIREPIYAKAIPKKFELVGTLEKGKIIPTRANNIARFLRSEKGMFGFGNTEALFPSSSEFTPTGAITEEINLFTTRTSAFVIQNLETSSFFYPVVYSNINGMNKNGMNKERSVFLNREITSSSVILKPNSIITEKAITNKNIRSIVSNRGSSITKPKDGVGSSNLFVSSFVPDVVSLPKTSIISETETITTPIIDEPIQEPDRIIFGGPGGIIPTIKTPPVNFGGFFKPNVIFGKSRGGKTPFRLPKTTYIRDIASQVFNVKGKLTKRQKKFISGLEVRL